MSALSSILHWLDGENPGSSSRDDFEAMSSETKVEGIPDNDAHMRTPCEEPSDERMNFHTNPHHSSVTAIEADLMEVSTKAVHAVRDWGSEYCD